MKILLLTYSFNYNYGALLQAYATVKYLESQGHSVTVPDNHPSYLVGNSSFFRGLGLKRKPIAAIWKRLRQFKRYRRFDRFRQLLPIDSSLNSKAAIERALSRFDVVLTGSDQTWNTKFMPAYEPYFYQGFFEGARKVSYAACFGTKEQKESLLLEAVPDLLKFHSIAVRNALSRDIVARLIGVAPTVVVDPTLLHNFREFVSPAEKSGGKSFAMVYALDPTNFEVAQTIVDQVRKVESGIEVHFVNGEKNFDKPAWADRLINDYGPLEFLQALQSSRCLITDSFHGLIFAQKFSKPCVVYSSGWRSERIMSMMEDFSASGLLVQGSDADRIEQVVSHVLAQGGSLQPSDTLLAKTQASKAYLDRALASA